MNRFAGSITFTGEIDIDSLPFPAIISESRKGSIVFMRWETEFQSAQELVGFIHERVTGEVLAYDISIETEDRIHLMLTELPRSGTYSFVAFHGKSFQEVLDFSTKLPGKVVSVREAEDSDKLGGRTIKVDIIS